MNQMKRICALFIVGLLLAVMIYQPASGHKVQPSEIYHRAWQLVRDNYYDPSFNGVNWKELEHKFDSKMDTVDDAHKYIKVMLKSLNDPYTRFLDVKAFQDENDAIDAKIVGIGITLSQTKDKTKLLITRTIEEGPAEQAGVKAGDEIVAIDNANAVGITPEQAAEKIRGQAGSAVCLSVKREGDIKKFPIVRREINIKAVSTKMIDNNIGVITLTTFISNDAAREFRQALKKLNKTDGLIIDLRDNPGGLLSNALEIADMLLEKPDQTIVSTISRHGKHPDVASGTPLTHQPIVVLVDEESASASEILAAALKDNKRAYIVGNKTYGKGLVQEINKLPGGSAVHITVSRYLTPNGDDINKIGIKPDMTVAKKEEQMDRAVDCMKAKIANLKNPTVRTSSLSYSN